MPEQITSRKNEWVRYAVGVASSAQTRRREGRFFVEGARLCMDAAASGASVYLLFYTEQARRKYAQYLGPIMETAEHCYEVEPHVAELLAETKSTQGIFCVCSMPEVQDTLDTISAQKPYVALETIQDPGNLGAVLRTAEALGTAGVLLAGNCCDVFSPKVLRASMGAVFRLPLWYVENMAQAADYLRGESIKTYAAVPDADAMKITECRLGGKGVLVIGNEGNGLTQDTIKACSMRVTIPMLGRAESLNAASSAAILMWEQVREMEHEHG